MGGVDVEGGADGGRRVCAAATRAGVLLRPLGETVVLMPPLTVTEAEVERIVDVLAGAIAWLLGRLGRPRVPAGGGRRPVAGGAGPTTPPPSTTFASNDYLGLSQHPAVIDAAHAALDRWGAGAGSARLVAGARSVHAELEAELADWKGTEAALLFPTGYAANLGVLTTFGPAGARILSDERNHASIVDGCRLARADVEVYDHADLSHVADLLAAGSAIGPAHDRRHRHRLLHGRRRGAGRQAGPAVRRPRGPARARRGPRRPRPPPRPRRRRAPPGGHPLQDPRVGGRLRGRQPPVRRAARQPGPVVHLHHRPRPRRHRRRPRRPAHPALGRRRAPRRPPPAPRDHGGRARPPVADRRP